MQKFAPSKWWVYSQLELGQAVELILFKFLSIFAILKPEKYFHSRDLSVQIVLHGQVQSQTSI